MNEWHDINTAPKDGSPVWARGWDWGKPDTSRHHGWVFWNGEEWEWARSQDEEKATYLTEWVDLFKQQK